MSMNARAIATIALLLTAGAPLRAPAATPAQITAVSGDVSIVRADTGTQETASPASTLSDGDYVATGENASSSLQIGGQTLRLDAQTQVRVVDAEGGAAEVQIAAGNVDVGAPTSGAGAQIDTPTATVRPDRPGTFRVSVGEGGQTVVRVSSGSVTIDGPSGVQTVAPGATVVADAGWRALT
jgi:hypothetical protein